MPTTITNPPRSTPILAAVRFRFGFRTTSMRSQMIETTITAMPPIRNHDPNAVRCSALTRTARCPDWAADAGLAPRITPPNVVPNPVAAPICGNSLLRFEESSAIKAPQAINRTVAAAMNGASTAIPMCAMPMATAMTAAAPRKTRRLVWRVLSH